jgi:hypothetical protein
MRDKSFYYYFNTVTQGFHIIAVSNPDDDPLRIETCRVVKNILLCNFMVLLNIG